MEREPLDSVEYESSYLELRPTWERVTGRTEAPDLTRLPQVDVGAVASTPYPPADISLETVDPPRSPTSPRNLAGQAVLLRHPRAVHPPGAPGDTPRRITAGCCPCVAGHRASRQRLRCWSLLGSGLVVAVSACLGFVADLEQHAARGLFIAVAGVLILGWARLAWRGTARAGPFGADIAQGVDRLVTALGTFFAVALWARYANHASAAFSRTIVVLLCGVGLVGGVIAPARALHS